MRILIDLQGAQATHSRRGIGRYSLSLAKALVRQKGLHEIRLLLNAHYAQSVSEIHTAFEGYLPGDHIHTWHAVEPFSDECPGNARRRDFASQVRSAVIASIRPDFLLITSLFEGPGNAGLVKIDPNGPPTAVILYDLIPWVHQHVYLEQPAMKAWYEDRLRELQKSCLLLSISEHSRREAIQHLGWPPDHVVNISTACDDIFAPADVSVEMRQEWTNQYALTRPFLLYTGGIDHRKNIERLIRAYAKLSLPIRTAHHLVIVCAIPNETHMRLKQEAANAGLMHNELIFTNFVSDEQLVGFYNACKAFVFPSWHEGFGLPALEAMRCGKAVIAASNTSLPEVIGYPQALFDPFDEDDIHARIEWILGNDEARHQLEAHAIAQASLFDWDKTATTALSAMAKQLSGTSVASAAPPKKPRLACISPLPPEQSGISDYTAQLLKVLSAHYDINVIVQQPQVSDEWVSANCLIHTVDWFLHNHFMFDRVLYHFGNSHFHEHMISMIERVPGVVVLHDFYLSGLQSHFLQGDAGKSWRRLLYTSHGYQALLADQLPSDRNRVVWQYPCNIDILQQALGVIVHSDHSCRLANHWYGPQAAADWRVIPLLREAPDKQGPARQCARVQLQLPAEAFVVCTFGLIGAHKLSHELLDAFLGSALARDPNCLLVFVGGNDESPYGTALVESIKTSGLSSRIRITGWTDTQDYQRHLVAADIGVQLRTFSRGETSAALLDCMSHGLPTIVNANGSMADLDPTTVWRLPDHYYPYELSLAIETLWKHPEIRAQLGQRARQLIAVRHEPEACAQQYKDAIEHFQRRAHQALPSHLQKLNRHGLNAAEHAQATVILSDLMPPQPRPRQLLVDISELVRHDARTGIQRVTRAILNEWLHAPPPGWRVEPVCAQEDTSGYRYARRYTANLLGLVTDWTTDEPVQAGSGDVFIGLDLQPTIIPAQVQTLRQWQRKGVSVRFVAYDLLPVQNPQYFLPGAAKSFTRWLETISEFDAVISISRSTRNVFKTWLNENRAEDHPRLNWFQLGADVEQSIPTQGMPDNAVQVIGALQARPSFLMVGTLEPRKGHAQVLDAFEQLWRQGHELTLVIVGRQGWMADALAQRLQEHPENSRRLIWLQSVSDEFLSALYKSCAALIAASYAEGYGLPLIEAARHGCPILARDIPVFREVAETHAFFFDQSTGPDLSQAIVRWLVLHAENRHPTSLNMHTITWRESAQQLLKLSCQRITPTHPSGL